MQALKQPGLWPLHWDYQAQLLMRELYLTREANVGKEKKQNSKSKVTMEPGRDQPDRMVTGGRNGLQPKEAPDDKNIHSK